ncbi:MAG: VWA domain-containing protein, partial [Verrucomicrobiota bacterium]
MTQIQPSQTRIPQGASVEIETWVEASSAGSATLRLFENGVEVERREILLDAGQPQRQTFLRSPSTQNVFTYRATVENYSEPDAIRENNSAATLVDVKGNLLALFLTDDTKQGRFLRETLAQEDIRLQSRPPKGAPIRLSELANYDAVILSNVDAEDLPDGFLTSLQSYVEDLGGGLVVIGGPQSFGLGNYERTPLEDLLPVLVESFDEEEDPSSALALILDRSGSMAGEKLEICKSACIATADLLQEDDYLGVYAFDSTVYPIVPLTPVGSGTAITNQISLLSAGGGTNIKPAILAAQAALRDVRAKVKHMIVLTDGETLGQGYQALAAECREEGMTISTVAVGAGAQIPMLQGIAAAGGGRSYVTMDPSTIPRIFTQDTILHTRRLLREDPFVPMLSEAHPIVESWETLRTPPLLGYVWTRQKPAARTLLTAKDEDPLLAHWRVGLGKVTAFTSDCTSRWSQLWLSSARPSFTRLWAQILRNTARDLQSRNMDLRIMSSAEGVTLQVDLLDDAGTRRNDADLQGTLFFARETFADEAIRELTQQSLPQTAPGRYESSFTLPEPGAYLIQVQAGAQSSTATHIHYPLQETAAGQLDRELLEELATITGGSTLTQDASLPILEGNQSVQRTSL